MYDLISLPEKVHSMCVYVCVCERDTLKLQINFSLSNYFCQFHFGKKKIILRIIFLHVIHVRFKNAKY